jgi:hypothetical protein
MRRLIAHTSLLVALIAAGPAAAQTPTIPGQPGQPGPQPAGPQPPTAPPKKATLKIAHQKVGADGATLAGRYFRIAGRLTPVAAGERVTIRLYARGRVARKRTVTAKGGRFRARFRSFQAARFVIRATHKRSAALTGARSNTLLVDNLPRRVKAGQTGLAVRLMQRKLDIKGYVVGRRGLLDARTGRAILAFRKVSGLPRNTRADRRFMSRLANDGGQFRLKFPNARGRHVEADLSRQVLVLANGGHIDRIYPTSSGKPSTPTIRGRYRFYLAQPGINSHGMYYSKYFIRGYAIHGYHSVPTYAASHGCLRVPIPDARSIYGWIHIGDRIDVYR